MLFVNGTDISRLTKTTEVNLKHKEIIYGFIIYCFCVRTSASALHLVYLLLSLHLFAEYTLKLKT